MKYCLIIYLLCISNIAVAYYPDSLQAADTLTRACKLIRTDSTQNVIQAKELTKIGLGILAKNDDHLNWLIWHKNLGRAWQFREKNPDPDTALAIYQKGLTFRSRNAKTPKELKAKASLLMHIAYAFKKTSSDLIAVRDHYLWASKIYVDTLNTENFYVARNMYHELGNAYTNLKDFENAQHYLEKVRDISRKAEKWEAEETEKWRRYAFAISDLGAMYNVKKEYKRAIAIVEEGLLLKDSIDAENHIGLLVNLGLYYYQAGDLKNALQYSDLATIELESADPDSVDCEDLQYDLYVNYGRIYKALKDYKRSKLNYTQALEIPGNEFKNSRKRARIFMHINFGALYTEWDKPTDALRELHECLIKLMPTFTKADSTALPNGEDLIAERLLIYTFDLMAKNFTALSIENTSHIASARQCYQLALQVEELMLQEYFLEGSSLAVLDDHKSYKENALEFAFKYLWQNNPTAEDKNFIFQMSERSRASLLSKEYSINANQFIGDPQKQHLLKRRKELKKQTTHITQLIYALKEEFQPDQIQLDSLSRVFRSARSELNSVNNQILKSDSSMHKYDSLQSVASVQKSLSADQMLLEYFLGEPNIFIIGLTQNDFYFWKLDTPQNLERTVKRLNKSIKEREAINNFAAPSFKLYQGLIKEVIRSAKNNISRLVIIPDGILNLIPFEVLITQSPGDSLLYKDLEYLLRTKSISYAPSASLFLQQKKPGKKAEKLFAGFAPEYDQIDDIAIADTISSDDKLLAILVRAGNYNLPGAEEEVHYVDNLLNGDEFIGEFALKSTFKEKAKDYQILLLSMHSLVDNVDSKRSIFIFTKDSLGKEDYQLKAFELDEIEFNADLVVLSACDTGLGEIHNGEGVMSLSRSFFSAGVASTVMTLWKIPSSSSSIIVQSFFENLKNGDPKDIALQRAKISFLDSIDNAKATLPLFWAGFVVNGNVDSMNLNPMNYSQFFAWIILAILFLILARYVQVKISSK